MHRAYHLPSSPKRWQAGPLTVALSLIGERSARDARAAARFACLNLARLDDRLSRASTCRCRALAQQLRLSRAMALDQFIEAPISASSSTDSYATRVRSTGRVRRYLLGGLLAFGALNAFGGGYYGLSGAKGVPLEWLEGSPFRDYSLPSLILMVVVGGSLLVAALAVLTGRRRGRMLALGSTLIVFAWLAVQLTIIGYVSWMQPATAGLGLAILALARSLQGPMLRPGG